MDKRTAVIIKGNPKFISGNSRADDFYREIQLFLEELGYQVSFDPGEPYTSPPNADLWIGHSRGVDRLRFAPSGTKILCFGSSAPGSINHPKDAANTVYGPSDIIPNEYHYVFTADMKNAITKIAAGGVDLHAE